MYIEILRKYEVKQTPEFTLKILMYELGKLCQIDIYEERFGSAGFIGEYPREFSDAITMLFLFGEQIGVLSKNLEDEAEKVCLEDLETSEDPLMVLVKRCGDLYPVRNLKIPSLLVLAMSYAKILAIRRNLSWNSLVHLGLITFQDRMHEVHLKSLQEKTRGRG